MASWEEYFADLARINKQERRGLIGQQRADEMRAALGRDKPEALQCPHCSAYIPPGNFCIQCGRGLK